MIAICIPNTDNEETQNQWDYLIYNFNNIDQVYIVGGGWISNSTKKAVIVESVNDLPDHLTKVLVTPENGTNYQGETNLVDFKHPSDDVVYIFGPNNKHLDNDHMKDAVVDDSVYLPIVEETYNFMAGAVVLYDRVVKNG